MNQHFSPRRANMAWVALLLVPVLALAQSPYEENDSTTKTTTNNNDNGLTMVATDLTSAEKKPWRLRLDLSLVDPSGNVGSANPGGTVLEASFDRGVGVGLRGEYQFSPRFGVEVGVLAAGGVDLTSGNFGHWYGNEIEVSGFAPFTVGLNFHLTPDRSFDLYAGPQLALVKYSSIALWTDFAFAGTSVSVDSDVGWGAILGLDVPLGDHGWMLQANVRYIDTDMKDAGGPISFNSEFNPVILSVGFGYRF